MHSSSDHYGILGRLICHGIKDKRCKDSHHWWRCIYWMSGTSPGKFTAGNPHPIYSSQLAYQALFVVISTLIIMHKLPWLPCEIEKWKHN